MPGDFLYSFFVTLVSGVTWQYSRLMVFIYFVKDKYRARLLHTDAHF